MVADTSDMTITPYRSSSVAPPPGDVSLKDECLAVLAKSKTDDKKFFSHNVQQFRTLIRNWLPRFVLRYRRGQFSRGSRKDTSCGASYMFSDPEAMKFYHVFRISTLTWREEETDYAKSVIKEVISQGLQGMFNPEFGKVYNVSFSRPSWLDKLFNRHKCGLTVELTPTSLFFETFVDV